MVVSAHRLPYNQTHCFSPIVIDYLDGAPGLKPFLAHTPDAGGIREAIDEKRAQVIDRSLLVRELQKQYTSVPASEAVSRNIEALASAQTFTVCTAHQPNLFTGPLYFLYKILHAIRLAAHLQESEPPYRFVPVYYMGCEDADLEELNHFHVEGKRYEWNTTQKGSVGRMLADAELQQLFAALEGQLSVYPHGKAILGVLRQAYAPGKTILQATFELVHHLFADFGLVVLIPDNPELKRTMLPVFREELFRQTSSPVVTATSERLSELYNVQASARDINLFYLKGDVRERIVASGDGFAVLNKDTRFTAEEMEEELQRYPDRFSPNVILRGVFQETILPNVAFIGGGGELAYWLQLKDLFRHHNVPYPVLVLRNSYLLIEEKWKKRIDKLGLGLEELFLPSHELMTRIVARYNGEGVSLNGNVIKAEEVYERIREQAESVDPTLSRHVAAIRTRSLNLLKELEKKMLRAEKRKYSDQQRQIDSIKEALFPGGLQERQDNFLLHYALWGPGFIQALYTHALALEQQFTVLVEGA